jgi:hypothetical protein
VTNSPNDPLKVVVTFDQSKMVHGRRVYGLWDVVGALGGAVGVIAGFFSMFVGNHPEIAFVMKAMSNLFFVRPFDKDINKPVVYPQIHKEIDSEHKMTKKLRRRFFMLKACPCFKFMANKEQKTIDTKV